MKKTVCLLLTLLMLCPLFAACADTPETTAEPTAATTETPVQTTETPSPETETPTPTPSPTEEPTPTESKTPVKPDPVRTEEFDKNKYYTIATVDGEKLEWNSKRLQVGTAVDVEGTFWTIGSYEVASGRSYSVFYAGDGNKDGINMGNVVTKGGKVNLGKINYPTPALSSAWVIKKNEDGKTYKIVYGQIPNFAMRIKNGKATLEVLEDASDFVIEEYEFVSEKYAQWHSEKGNITVRLPIDVVVQIYDRIRSRYKDESKASLTSRIKERMQLFAESAQKCYDSLIDLTNFVPYQHIVIYAYEHQGVMAGVVGADPNIYVNVDWYVDDMVKMMQRWDDPDGRKEDYNFCILHEMGHMFDWDRGWNFESEMQTDLKASYVLWQHKDDEYGAWAAPSEYAWNRVFNIGTLDTGAYDGLSGGDMMFRKTDDTVSYKYSIYRCAEMYVSYIKYCEKTEGLRGFEAMKDMFHWFQEKGLTVSSNSRVKRFMLFNQILEEFTGQNVGAYMTKNFSKNDWYATVFTNAECPAVERKNASGEGTGTYDVQYDKIKPEVFEILPELKKDA